MSAGGADAGPAPQQVLEGVEDLVEGQAGVRAFGSSRRRVRKAWAAVTRLLPFLPVSNSSCGRRRDHRQVFDRMLHRARTGMRRQDPPERFGPVEDRL